MVLTASVLGSEASAQKEFSIRESRAGSNINVKAISAAFPFEKRWHELTSEQQAMFRAKYVNLGDDDEPPFPEDGMGAVSREVRTYQNVVRVDGQLVLTVSIDEGGKPQSVFVFQSPDDKLAKAVAYAVMKINYKPARCAGKPCAMDFPFSFQFSRGF